MADNQDYPEDKPQDKQRTKPQTTEAMIASFLSGKSAIIADADASVRNILTKLLTTIGVNPSKIYGSWLLNDANEYIRSTKPEIVIMSYDFEPELALKALADFNQLHNNSFKTLFVFVTEKNSNTLACLTAAQDVDSLIIKPFTFAVAKQTIIDALLPKISASGYRKLIHEGNRYLEAGKLPEAERLYIKAAQKNPEGALAWHQLGLIELKRKNRKAARELFEKGIANDPKHFKCLSSIFEMQYDDRMYPEAYQTALRITKLYPLRMSYLPKMIRISIALKKYEDLGNYYKTFSVFEDINIETIRYLSAGLIVSGKYYLESDDKDQALQCFNKAEAIADSSDHVMKEIISCLLSTGMNEEANEFLRRASPSVQNSPEINAIKLERANALGPPSKVLQMSFKLLDSGIYHPKIFEIALNRSIELQMLDGHFKSILMKAIEMYPELKAKYAGYSLLL